MCGSWKCFIGLLVVFKSREPLPICCNRGRLRGLLLGLLDLAIREEIRQALRRGARAGLPARKDRRERIVQINAPFKLRYLDQVYLSTACLLPHVSAKCHNEPDLDVW